MTIDPSLLRQKWLEEFEPICAFQDAKAPDVIQSIAQDEGIVSLARFLQDFINKFSSDKQNRNSINNILSRFHEFRNFDDIIAMLVETILPAIENTMSGCEAKGLSQLDPSGHYLFISNHRDIVMDSLALNMLLHRQGLQPTHSAIGDNLLATPMANRIARLLRCFTVKRSIKSPRAVLQAMKIQSAYIRYLSFNENANIWIAQKEGRSKDNRDQTNPALIKMLALAKPETINFADYVAKLNIVPVSISYEWDPCDIDKVQFILSLEQHGDYTKQPGEDAAAMKKGIIEYKGKVCLNFDTSFLGSNLGDNDHKSLARKIDSSIINNYEIFPVNLAAIMLLNERTLPEKLETTMKQVDLNTISHNLNFDKAEIEAAKNSLQKRVEGHDQPVQTKTFELYAAPLLQRYV